jgi:NDP-sugar pyrophosphorylase family protein
MKAIIMAAGVGSRMRPLTDTTPKPMLPILGRPLLEHIFGSLPDAIDEVILVVGYKREQIERHFGAKFGGKRVAYVVQEKATGTADALALCRSLLADGERFVILNADDIYGKESVERCLRHSRAILVGEVPDPRPFGVVEVGPDGVVKGLVEKPEHPKSNLIAPGVYVLDTHLFEFDPIPAPSGERYFTTQLAQMLKVYPVYAEQTGFWINCTKPEDLAKAQEVLKTHAID